MMIFRKTIPRRAFLRGAGASLALPLLDSMVPAFAAATQLPVRLSIVYMPNGINMDKWFPKTDGPAFQFSPTLEPLAPFRE